MIGTVLDGANHVQDKPLVPNHLPGHHFKLPCHYWQSLLHYNELAVFQEDAKLLMLSHRLVQQ